MNKIIIPSLLAVTVLIAGIFAFTPVDQATAVHTSNTLTLATDSVVDANIAVGAFGAAEIATAAIDKDAIGTGAIAADIFVAAAIDADAIKDGAIGTSELAADVLTSTTLADAVTPSVVGVMFTDGDLSSAATCTSDKAFILYVMLKTIATKTITIDPSTDTADFVFVAQTGDLSTSLVLHGESGDSFVFTGNDADSDATIAIFTQPGSSGTCT